MPELPEIETFKREVDRTSLRKRIRCVRILDSSLLKNVSPRRLSAMLRGHRLVDSRRHGKYLGIRSDRGDWIVFHFGMTGALIAREPSAGIPEYAKVVTEFADDSSLAYVSQRKLGMIKLVADFETFTQSKQLGPDAFEIDVSMCWAQLRGRRGIVKSALMNQSNIAGIGNIYSDEILFQARVRPNRNSGRRCIVRARHRGTASM